MTEKKAPTPIRSLASIFIALSPRLPVGTRAHAGSQLMRLVLGDVIDRAVLRMVVVPHRSLGTDRWQVARSCGETGATR